MYYCFLSMQIKTKMTNTAARTQSKETIVSVNSDAVNSDAMTSTVNLSVKLAPEAIDEPITTNNLWRHIKTGGLYEVLMHGTMEADKQDMVIYKAQSDDRVWVRPAIEFYDGRFQQIEKR